MYLLKRRECYYRAPYAQHTAEKRTAATVSDSGAVESSGYPGTTSVRKPAEVAGRDLPADEYFQDHGVPNPEDVYAPGLPGAIGERVIPAGGAAEKSTLWFW